MEEKLTRIAENSVELYNRCHSHHYTAFVTGDGTDSLTVKLPFTPDLVQLICTDPRLIYNNRTVYFLAADINCLGLAAGAFQYVRNGNVYGMTMTSTSVWDRISFQEDGAVTIGGLMDGDTPCLFTQGLQFQVVATKLTDKTIRQRYEEFVEGLTGSGTAQVCKARVYEVFTAEEWAALIATKPDWTFQEV